MYDAYRRAATNSATGVLPEHALVTAFQRDARGLVTNYVQASGVSPSTCVSRRFDGYGQVTNEQVAILGQITNTFTQTWDAAGLRAALVSPTAEFDYSYRVDGLMTGVSAFGAFYWFGYGDNGLLSGRGSLWRQVTVDRRDGQGRLLQQTAKGGGTTALVETLSWRANSTLGSYTATRSGAGGWNDNRVFQYNARNQLINEPVGLSSGTAATNTYSFDANGLGVLTGIQLSGALANNWQATGLSPFSQVASETWSQSGLTVRAGGSVVGASSVTATLDGSPISPSVVAGRWYADLSLAPGNHTLAATANYPVGQCAATATSGFTVLGANNVTNYYDAAGNVTNRSFANGKSQALAWDAAGRLVSLIERTYSTNGFNWAAIYDALGRRLRTVQVPVVNGATNSAMTLTIDSFFDPQVEFSEIAVTVNGSRTWKLMGPDLDGRFGSLQGVGGVEATIPENPGFATAVVNDCFGNIQGTAPGVPATWTSTRVSAYGPEIGYQAPSLSVGTPSLADSLAWRSRRIDPSGLCWLGARYYDPLAGRFMSADPLGHEASWDLYSFCSGDPLKRFDPTGRFGKSVSGSSGGVDGDLCGGSRAGCGGIGPTWFDRMNQEQAFSDYWRSYYETEADMFQMRYGAYFQAETPTWGDFFSSALNMTPFVGAFKMWIEGGFTGKDMVTGQWLDRSGWETFFGSAGNALGSLSLMSGVMSEAAQGARFAPGYADWQARSVLSWQSSPLEGLATKGRAATVFENAPRGFSNWRQGIQVHQNFEEALNALHDTRPGDWLMKTAPRQTGVDATYIGPTTRYPGVQYAELKPYSQNTLDTFGNQLQNWGLPQGQTELFFYNRSGVIGSSGFRF